MKLFVYGTLLRGLERESVLSGSRFLGTVVVRAKLYDLGSYPGIIDGEGQVIGEVYEIDQATLKRLDDIEGYKCNNPAGSEYVRKEVKILTTEVDEPVIAYFYNRKVKECDRIVGGDYRKHRFVF